jgi:hypothetical protein
VSDLEGVVLVSQVLEVGRNEFLARNLAHRPQYARVLDAAAAELRFHHLAPFRNQIRSQLHA